MAKSRRQRPALVLAGLLALLGLRSLAFANLGSGSFGRRARVQRAAGEAGAAPCIAVVGATGNLGQRVVRQLIASSGGRVLAVARNQQKAEEAFANITEGRERLQIVQCDAGDEKGVVEACKDAEAAVWCVSGGAGGGPVALGTLLLQSWLKQTSAEERGLLALAKSYAPRALAGSPPQVIMVSSAAVTRPSWSEEKKQRLPGCADIPIVRLNPFGILDKKRAVEDLLRNSGARYTVVRPVGLNDNWPAGRPLLVQGDVAVGRISRNDVAWLIAQLLQRPEAAGKTLETVAIAGYPKPDDCAPLLSKLRNDNDARPLDEAEVAATYTVLQQLLPGEKQDSAGLAMGQTYEQFDSGKEGRLGARGKEKVPDRVA